MLKLIAICSGVFGIAIALAARHSLNRFGVSITT
jgi:hypothetical protein